MEYPIVSINSKNNKMRESFYGGLEPSEFYDLVNLISEWNKENHKDSLKQQGVK